MSDDDPRRYAQASQTPLSVALAHLVAAVKAGRDPRPSAAMWAELTPAEQAQVGRYLTQEGWPPGPPPAASIP